LTTIAPERPEIGVASGYRGFLELCERIDFTPEPHQRKIAKAALGSRELLVLLPRGNGKSAIAGALCVHHLLTHPEPRIYLAAASGDQARVVFEYARAAAEDIDGVVIRHLELRVPSGFLRVLASDAPKLHGIHPTLAVIDEMQAFKDGAVYEALRTGLLEDSKLWTITTAGQGAESPLGRLRARALAGSEVRHRGAFTAARNGALRLLEWAVAEDRDVTDSRVVKSANPASGFPAPASPSSERRCQRPHFAASSQTSGLPAWAPGFPLERGRRARTARSRYRRARRCGWDWISAVRAPTRQSSGSMRASTSVVESGPATTRSWTRRRSCPSWLADTAWSRSHMNRGALRCSRRLLRPTG
jgi:hypothetical protein